jgi:hypothetical protein
MAIASLVVALVAIPALCLCSVASIGLGIAAIVLGRQALTRIRESNGALGGHGLAQAGWITGLAVSILSVLLVFAGGLLLLLARLVQSSSR